MKVDVDYFNPCSTKFRAIEQFKTLSFRQKVCVGTITVLFICTILLIPVVIPVFRLLVGRCIPETTQKSEIRSTVYDVNAQNLSASVISWQIKVQALIEGTRGNCTQEQEEECRSLLREHPDYINKPLCKDMLNGTLLHLLAKIGPPQFIAIFAEFNADFGVQDSQYKNTPLHWAIANAKNGTALAIIKHAPRDVLNIQGYKGNTPLHLSIAKGYTDLSCDKERLECSNFEITKALVEKGACIDIVNSPQLDSSHNGGDTPFHLACARRDLPTMHLLTQNHVNLEMRNDKGKTPLDLIDLTYPEASELIRNTVGCFLLPEELFHQNQQEARKILDLKQATIAEEN